MKDSIKVLIAEDMIPLQERYCNYLAKDKSITVVGCAKSGYETIMQAAINHPDVIMMDVEMETKTAGLDATREILRQFPDIKIIILTVYSDESIIFSAFQYGVVDYLIKTASAAEVISAVQDAYYDRSPIRPLIAEKIRKEFKRIKNGESSILSNFHILSKLTDTEMNILGLLMQGKTRTEICEIRHIELSTLKTELRNILKKFNKKSVFDVLNHLNNMDFFDIVNRAKCADE